MTPEDNTSPSAPQNTTPESGATPVQNGTTVEVATQPISQSENDTFADTLSPEQSAPVAPVEPVQVPNPDGAAPSSGVVNATSPITDNAPAQQSAEDPGHTMGVIGLVLAVFMPLIGLVLSLVARSKSKKAGHKNGLALAGIIVSTALIVVTVVGVALFAFGASKVVNFCEENGPGTHTTEDGAVITCSSKS